MTDQQRQLEQNKKNMIPFYGLMFNRTIPLSHQEICWGDLHSAQPDVVAYGKQAFIEYFERMAKDYPSKRVHFKRAITEGKYAVLHCHREWRGNSNVVDNWAGIDIFRLDDNGKIAEHWDVLEREPEKSANDNTMF